MSFKKSSNIFWGCVDNGNGSRLTPKPRRTETCDKPVNKVTWVQADAFCKEIGMKLGMKLPSEAEREGAARGPSGMDEYGTANGRLIDDQGKLLAQYGRWFFSDGRATAGFFPPKLFGEAKIYDLAGNLWEWVSDWYGPYSADAARDPQGPKEGKYKVVHGGSWYSYGLLVSRDLRAADRNGVFPDDRDIDIGFRCVQDSKK